MSESTTVESEVSGLEERLLELAKSKPEGISNEYIAECIPEASLKEVADSLNRCLRTGSLDLFHSKSGLLYKYKEVSKRNVVKGGDAEEKVVFKIIEEAGNKGIWIREIRHKSNLNMTQLNKVLKSLEAKKIIKAVKSVTASKKKVYMLYNLEADSSVSGGKWYQDQDFESEFVDVLGQQCHRFLKQKSEDASSMGGGPLLARTRSYATVSDVHKFISELGISKVELTVEDIESILYTVVLDNNAERIVASNGAFLYRAVNRFMGAPGLVKTTCGVCPISSRCADTGLVNPKDCHYFKEWLE